MELRRNPEDGTPLPVSLGFPPPSIRVSAFSKPLLPASSTLVFPRAAAGGTVPSNTINSATIDHPLRSQPFDQDPFHIPISSPPQWVGVGGGASFAGQSSKTEAASTSSSSIPAETEAKYRECLRNHAAGVGGHVLDGCGEFMPGSGDALKCAACGCHRSFHRKESDADHHQFSNCSSPHQRGRIPLLLPPSSHHRSLHHNPVTPPSPGLPAFGVNYRGGAGAGAGVATPSSSSEEQAMAPKKGMPGGSSRKRFRTKFTTEQKERMQDFAERVGWKIQKQDGALVERFCAEVGVKRQVLRVWMHNNKHTRNQLQLQNEQQLERRMMASSPIPNNSPSPSSS